MKRAFVVAICVISMALPGCTIGGGLIGATTASSHNASHPDDHVSVGTRAAVGALIGLALDVTAIVLIVNDVPSEAIGRQVIPGEATGLPRGGFAF